MKYVIDINEVENQPEDWAKIESWPGPGLYIVTGQEYAIFQVPKTGSVGYFYPADEFLKAAYKDAGEAVSETLLLKAIAAAASRQLTI